MSRTQVPCYHPSGHRETDHDFCRLAKLFAVVAGVVTMDFWTEVVAILRPPKSRGFGRELPNVLVFLNPRHVWMP